MITDKTDNNGQNGQSKQSADFVWYRGMLLIAVYKPVERLYTLARLRGGKRCRLLLLTDKSAFDCGRRGFP